MKLKGLVILALAITVSIQGCASNKPSRQRQFELDNIYQRSKSYVESLSYPDSVPQAEYVPGYPVQYVNRGGSVYLIFELGEAVYSPGGLVSTVKMKPDGSLSYGNKTLVNSVVSYKKSGHRFLIKLSDTLPADRMPDQVRTSQLYCIPIHFLTQIARVNGEHFRIAELAKSITPSRKMLAPYDHLPEHVPTIPGYVFIAQGRYDLESPFAGPQVMKLEMDVRETLAFYEWTLSDPSKDLFGLSATDLYPLVNWLQAVIYYQDFLKARNNRTTFIAYDHPGLVRERQLQDMEARLRQAISVDPKWLLPHEKLTLVQALQDQHRLQLLKQTMPPMGRRLKLAPDLNWYSWDSGNDGHRIPDVAELRVSGSMVYQVMNHLCIGLGLDLFSIRGILPEPHLSEPSWFIDTPYIIASCQIPIRIQLDGGGSRLQITTQFRALKEKRDIDGSRFIADGWACDIGLGLCGREGYFYEDEPGWSFGDLTFGYRFGHLGKFYSKQNNAVLVWGNEEVPIEVDPNRVWIRIRLGEFAF